MSDWFRKVRDGFSKDEKEPEKIEDFVLYGDQDETALDEKQIDSEMEKAIQETEDMSEAEQIEEKPEDPELFETTRLDISELKEQNRDVFPAETSSPFFPGSAEGTDAAVQSHKKIKRFQNRKSVLLGSGILVGAVILISAVVAVLAIMMNPLRGYTEVTVSKGNVIPSMNTSGVMEANAYYSITSLVSGTVIESKPEVGDRVEAGSVLYKLDDTEAQLALKRAENQLDKSKAIGASSKVSTSRIYASDSGVIQTLNISTGSSVSAGQIVATLTKTDGTVVSVTSSVSGTVSAVSVSRGRSVSSGTLIATVTDDASAMTQKTNSYDQKSNEYDVEAARKQLENYVIKAPVSGVITEKNTKVGDNVAITNMDNPMMVIVDMNSMKFTFQVDEYTIMDMEVGQNAIITTDSIPNETFAGEVTRVASAGKADENGKVQFDVDVTVDEPGDLKAGMNVNAKIILASATNVLYLPEKALLEADGQNALVLVKEDKLAESAEMQDDYSDGASDEELAFPWIKVPKGCKLVTVKYGISDGTNVEIISGLTQGNEVVYDPDWETKELVPSTATATPSPAKAGSMDDFPGTFATTVPDSDSADVDDEELKRQIREKINEKQNGETAAPTATKKPGTTSL